MKVVFVTREGRRHAGARVRCYNFARELTRYGFQTEVFSYADDLGACDGEDESRMSLVRKLTLNHTAYHSFFKKQTDVIYVLQRVNYHILAPLLAAGLRRCRVIFDCDDWNIREDPVYYFGFYPSSKMEYLTRRVARNSWACVAASRYLQDYLSRFNSRVHYIPTGVDTGQFFPQERNDSGRVVFSWTGTAYHPEMGANLRFILDCFSEVAARRPDVFLTLAGEGRYFEEFRVVVDQHPLRERILISPWLPADAVAGFLAGTDVGLLPLIQDSKFNRAKSPTKLFEYMSMAKPVVASDLGEAGTIIDHGRSGLLAANRDSFIRSMLLLAGDSALRSRLGLEARARVDREFSLSGLGSRWAKIITEVQSA